MGASTAGQSAKPTASAKRRGLPGLGFAARTAIHTADLEVQLCAVNCPSENGDPDAIEDRAIPIVLPCPAVLQRGDAVEHRRGGGMVFAVGDEVAVALELELVVGVGAGQ